MSTKLELTPLMIACQASNSDEIKTLLSKGVSIESTLNFTPREIIHLIRVQCRIFFR